MFAKPSRSALMGEATATVSDSKGSVRGSRPDDGVPRRHGVMIYWHVEHG